MASRFVLPFADVGSGILPSSGAQLFFFKAGTVEDKDTFVDSDGLIANTNPVIADSKGLFPDIFIAGSYRVVLKDKNGSQKWEADPVGDISTTKEPLPLADGQVDVTFTKIGVDTASIFITGQNVDRGLLLPSSGSDLNDYTVTGNFTITLTRSYPAGSTIEAFGSLLTDSGEFVSFNGRTGVVISANGDYTASQITNVPAGNITAVEQQAVNAELDGFIAANTTNITTNATNITGNTTEIGIAKLNDAIYNKQTGTAYTLVPGDRGLTVSINNASANIITIDTNANQAVVVNAVILLRQLGAGVTTITAAAGVLLNGVNGGSVVFIDRYDTSSIDQQATDDWIFSGSGVVS